MTPQDPGEFGGLEPDSGRRSPEQLGPGQPSPKDLTAYALGLLDAPTAARVAAHLAGCAACRRYLAEQREVTDALDQLPVETFMHGPPDGTNALDRALREIRDRPDGGR